MDYEKGKNLTFKAAGSASSNIAIKAIKKTASSYVVEDVPYNSTYTVSDYGTTYTSVKLAIMSTDESTDFPITITSTGTAPASVEMARTTAEPIGYLAGSAGDTVAVGFDGAVGGKIDSIRIAIRRGGSTIQKLPGQIGQLDSTYSFMGGTASPFVKVYSTFTLTSPLSASPTIPYPVPWTNWVTVKFSPALDGTKPFVVGVVSKGIMSSDATANRVMIDSTTGGFNYSFVNTFLSDTASTPTWIYSTASSTAVWDYLMRAYVSFPTASGTNETVELSPKQFTVQQNYPNPFNPSTTINYSIPKDGNVKITVYNSLGKEVAKLVDEFQKAGAHSAHFAKSNLASGVYFYRVETGDNVKTLRMLLLK